MWKLSDRGRIDQLYVFKHLDGGYVPVGVLVFEGAGHRRQSRFSYAKSYLERRTGRPIDPISLPLGPRWANSQPEEVPLAFHDSGPDGWGKGLLDMAYPTVELGMAEYLASGGIRRTGDLAYGPTPEGPGTWRPDEAALVTMPADDDDLEALLEAAAAAEEGEAAPAHLALLLRGSSGLGGARPKARLRHEGSDWIAKFPAWGDRFDDPRMEAVCLDVAEAAGVEVPSRLLVTVRGRSVLLVERFDQGPGQAPLAYLSAGTLLKQPSVDYNTTLTYVDVALVGRQIGVDGTLPEMFRRFLVNSLIHNTDDHLRNHGFVADGCDWRLSPAFDVVPHLQKLRHVCAPAPGSSPEWSPADAFAQHARFGVSRGDARRIWDEVATAVRRMPDFMATREVSGADRALVLEALGRRGGPLATVVREGGRTGTAIEADPSPVSPPDFDEGGPLSSGTDGLEVLVVTRRELERAIDLRARRADADLGRTEAEAPRGAPTDDPNPIVELLVAASHAAVLRLPGPGGDAAETGDVVEGDQALSSLRDGFGRGRHRRLQISVTRAVEGLLEDDLASFHAMLRAALEQSVGRPIGAPSRMVRVSEGRPAPGGRGY